MKILHVLHHSVPYQDGYCIRSKQIVDFQRRLGLDVRVLTGAQHEFEVKRDVGVIPAPEQFDGVRYCRTARGDGFLARSAHAVPFAREVSMMVALRQSMRRLLTTDPVDVIHAHSPVLCGLPAAAVAREFGIPLVYEVRGFWEDGFVEGRWAAGDRALRYKISRYLETQVFARASAVVGISQHILADIAGRGITADKLHQVPNGVDTTSFIPCPKDVPIIQKHQLENRPVVGFIGSFYEFEGLECLLEAMTLVKRQVPEARLMLVGSGEQEQLIPRRIAELQLSNEVIVTGRVPHHQINGYYSVMDVLVYPRLRNRTTELTTPLKPLEAMAMGKPVVGSDVGGIRELLGNGSVGSLFEAGDSAALAERIVALLANPAERERLAASGRDYTLRERGWDRLVLKYDKLYRTLTEGSARHDIH